MGSRYMHGLNKMYFSNPGCSRALYEPELNLIEVFASVSLPRVLPENGLGGNAARAARLPRTDTALRGNDAAVARH
jgi:hypothetical protein